VVYKPCTNELERVWEWPDKLSNLFRGKVFPISWMPRVADLGNGVNQGTLPFGPECNVEVDCRAGRWMAQTLPVDWSGMPGVLDPNVIPRCRGVAVSREPPISHLYGRSATNVRFKGLEGAPHLI
jgi:hypothetical protein